MSKNNSITKHAFRAMYLILSKVRICYDFVLMIVEIIIKIVMTIFGHFLGFTFDFFFKIIENKHLD